MKLPTAVLALYRSIFIHTIQTVRFVIFVLHETCDSLPRKLRHELHKHTLILRPKNNPDEEHGYNLFNSPVCQQLYSGFKYVSSKSCDVQIDVRCVLQLRRRSTMKAIRIISYTLPPQKPSFVVLVELKHPLYWTALIVASLWDMTAPLFLIRSSTNATHIDKNLQGVIPD